MEQISLQHLDAYFLHIPEEIQPYILFVVGKAFGLVWNGFCYSYTYLKRRPKRKGIQLQCYSTICRSRRNKDEKTSCYSLTCKYNKKLYPRTFFKSAWEYAKFFFLLRCSYLLIFSNFVVGLNVFCSFQFFGNLQLHFSSIRFIFWFHINWKRLSKRYWFRHAIHVFAMINSIEG